MNYTYHSDCHELWANTDAPPPPPFPIVRRDTHRHAVQSIFWLPNHDRCNAPAVILPDLSAHLVIHQSAKGNIQARLIGPRTRALYINRRQRQRTFILRFEPVALSGYLPFPVHELLDRSIPLAALLLSGEEERFLQDCGNSSADRVINHALQLLDKLARLSKPSDRLIAQRFLEAPLTNAENKKVNSIARTLGLSERYLQRVVKAQTGLTPKMALRIIRLQKSLLAQQKRNRTSWAGLAQSAGYFDQSHMIDEYQRFLGASPEQFFYGSSPVSR